MGCDTASRQARRKKFAFERRLGASYGIDAGMEHQDGTVSDSSQELALGQPRVKPLTAGEQAVLAGRRSHQRVDNGRVRPKPERITHAYRR